MVPVLIVICIGVVLTNTVAISCYSNTDSYNQLTPSLVYFLGFLLTIFAALMAFAVSLAIGAFTLHADYSHPTSSKEIVNLRETTKTSGSLFLFAGQLRGDSTYNFYEKLPDGSYKQDYIYAADTRIIEAPDTKPRIDFFCDATQSDSWRIYFGSSICHNVVYVPPNSIQYSFKLGE